MKKNCLIFLLIATLVCLLSCNKEMFVDDTTMRFIAVLESETKTTLSGTPEDSFRKVLWSENDSIFVSNGSDASPFVNIGHDESECTTFEGEIHQGQMYYASYPYNKQTRFTGGKLTVNLAGTQRYVKNGVAQGLIPMVSRASSGAFNFLNLCGIFVVNITGTQEIEKITFKAYDQEGQTIIVSGDGTVDMQYDSFPVLKLDENAGTEISVQCIEPVKLNEVKATAFHFVLPPAEYYRFSLIIRTTEKKDIKISSKSPLLIKRSERTTTTPVVCPEMVYVNLSEDGTSNSYVVTAPGNYCFNATVQGNSSNSIGSPASADVLWETFGTATPPNVGDVVSDVSYYDGLIHFTVKDPMKSGNALIAVRNANNEILWSWHIWACADFDPRQCTQTYFNNAGVVMDRNLGAFSCKDEDNLTFGLMYQWGRKDPFLGAQSFKSNIQQAYVSSSLKAFPTFVWSSADRGTVYYSIKNPTHFIGRRNDSDGEWLYKADASCWGETKTQYDPCPPGWKVMSKNVLIKACKNNPVKAQISYYYGEGIFIYVANPKNTLSSPEPFFPACGYRHNQTSNNSEVGDRVDLWTSSFSGKKSCAFLSAPEMYIDGVYPHMQVFQGYYPHKLDALCLQPRSDGRPVRCCKE